MNFLKKIYNNLGWWMKPSCDQLAKYSFELSRNMVLGTLAYTYFSGQSAKEATVVLILLLAFGLMLVGISLARMAKNIEERDNGNF